MSSLEQVKYEFVRGFKQTMNRENDTVDFSELISYVLVEKFPRQARRNKHWLTGNNAYPCRLLVG